MKCGLHPFWNYSILKEAKYIIFANNTKSNLLIRAIFKDNIPLIYMEHKNLQKMRTMMIFRVGLIWRMVLTVRVKKLKIYKCEQKKLKIKMRKKKYINLTVNNNIFGNI